MESVSSYFPHLTQNKIELLQRFGAIIQEVNKNVNLISRQDIENFEERHLLPSLAFSKIVQFLPGSKVMDVGTGGGFPGIPLAILFPETQFTLIDSIAKKVECVKYAAQQLGLKNVKAFQKRAELIEGQFDFITGRAVTALPTFMTWVRNKISNHHRHPIPNGILYLKGGDLEPELAQKGIFPEKIYPLIDFYPEKSFLEGKYIVHFSQENVQKI